MDQWYQWVDSFPTFVVLDGGLGYVLSERGNNLDLGSMWSARLLVTRPEEVRLIQIYHLSFFIAEP